MTKLAIARPSPEILSNLRRDEVPTPSGVLFGPECKDTQLSPDDKLGQVLVNLRAGKLGEINFADPLVAEALTIYARDVLSDQDAPLGTLKEAIEKIAAYPKDLLAILDSAHGNAVWYRDIEWAASIEAVGPKVGGPKLSSTDDMVREALKNSDDRNLLSRMKLLEERYPDLFSRSLEVADIRQAAFQRALNERFDPHARGARATKDYICRTFRFSSDELRHYYRAFLIESLQGSRVASQGLSATAHMFRVPTNYIIDGEFDAYDLEQLRRDPEVRAAAEVTKNILRNRNPATSDPAALWSLMLSFPDKNPFKFIGAGVSAALFRLA